MNSETAAGSSLRWYALHTKAQQESRAEDNLRAWKVETLAPRLKLRRKGRSASEAERSHKSLFPRYIFAKFDLEASFHKIKFTRGVQSVVSCGMVPTPVDDEIIEIIQSQIDNEGFVSIGEQLQAGDKVLIQNGTFKNFTGIFEREYKDSERVKILLTTVNYQSHLMIGKDSIKKIA